MRQQRPTLRAALISLMVTVVIAAAALVWHNLPANTDIYAPFDVTASAGDPAVGRAVTGTLTGVQIAPRVKPESSRRPVAAIGVWVIVDATVSAIGGSGLPHAQLSVGPNTYSPSDRVLPGATLGALINPGIVTRGAWVFDVPPSLLDTAHSVALRVWVGDGRLDSRLVLTIDLDDSRVARTGTAVLDPPTESGQ